jgi:chromosome segregation ATPase
MEKESAVAELEDELDDLREEVEEKRGQLKNSGNLVDDLLKKNLSLERSNGRNFDEGIDPNEERFRELEETFKEFQNQVKEDRQYNKELSEDLQIKTELVEKVTKELETERKEALKLEIENGEMREDMKYQKALKMLEDKEWTAKLLSATREVEEVTNKLRAEKLIRRIETMDLTDKLKEMEDATKASSQAGTT